MYQLHLKCKCAPSIISNNGKYKLHSPLISKVETSVFKDKDTEVEISTLEGKEIKKEVLCLQSINSIRISMPTTASSTGALSTKCALKATPLSRLYY